MAKCLAKYFVRILLYKNAEIIKNEFYPWKQLSCFEWKYRDKNTWKGNSLELCAENSHNLIPLISFRLNLFQNKFRIQQKFLIEMNKSTD